MRRYFVSIILILMIAAFFLTLWMKKPKEVRVSEKALKGLGYRVESNHPDKTKKNEKAKSASSKLAEKDDKKSSKKNPKKIASAKKDEKKKPLSLKRKMRVIGFGWDMIAPGLLINGGKDTKADSLFKREGLDVSFSSLESPAGLESSLARGGEHKLGADIAMMPLPTFVASYDRIKALKPRILLVVGWSKGKDGLKVPRSISLANPPSKVRLLGLPGDPATFFSLYMFNRAGISPKRTRLEIAIKETKPRANNNSMDRFYMPHYFKQYQDYLAKLARLKARKFNMTTIATTRPTEWQSLHRFIATTSDTPRLIPIVAVASESFINKHQDALMVWGRYWLAGINELDKDVPKAARTIATIKGAPDALALIRRFGQIQAATLRENAELVGLAGRSALSLEDLFLLNWRIWRQVDVLNVNPPQEIPIATKIMTGLIGNFPSIVDSAPKATRKSKATTEKQIILTYQPSNLKADQISLVIARIASIFSNAELKVSTKRGLATTKQKILDAITRYDVSQSERIKAQSHRGKYPLRIQIYRQI